MDKIAMAQISRAQAEDDQICLTIVREPDVHIRVSLTPGAFADTLCTGRMVEGKIVRWRMPPPESK